MTNVFMKNIKKIPHSQTGNPLLGVILHTMLQVINFFFCCLGPIVHVGSLEAMLLNLGRPTR